MLVGERRRLVPRAPGFQKASAGSWEAMRSREAPRRLLLESGRWGLELLRAAMAIDCPERDGVSLKTDLTAKVLQPEADHHPTPCRKCHIFSWKELWVITSRMS